MKAIVILVILISATAHGAIFDSIDSVDTLRQKSAQIQSADRAPSSEKPVEAAAQDGVEAEASAVDMKAPATGKKPD